jgi:hypothetical protein
MVEFFLNVLKTFWLFSATPNQSVEQGWLTQISLWAANWKNFQSYRPFGPHDSKKQGNTTKISKKKTTNFQFEFGRRLATPAIGSLVGQKMSNVNRKIVCIFWFSDKLKLQPYYSCYAMLRSSGWKKHSFTGAKSCLA